MTELRAKAKELGINSFGKNKEALAEEVAAAEAESEETTVEIRNGMSQKTVTEAPVYDKPDYSSEIVKQQPAPDQATMIAMMAANMAKEATEKLMAMQQSMPQQKQATPEAVIAKKRDSDKRAISQQEKYDITIHGGFIGAPKYIPSCVNGHVTKIVLGKKAHIPLAHLENIERSLAMQKKNLDAMEEREQAAMKALGM